ncbi:MAG: glycoside hydrolase family 2 protein [Chthoniobacteraceae bacterium]
MRISLPLNDQWQFQAPGSARWLAATVPGCIHTDLRRHALIPDPFWGSNETELQWIEERDWRYRCDFEATPEWLAHEHLELVAEGLDTVATVWLNGQVILETENMFIGHRAEVSGLLRRGKNRLEILFGSPMNTIRSRQAPGDLREWNDPVGGSAHLRKGGFAFGWDWGPRFVASGIYKPIRLEAWSGNRFENVRLRQKHGAKAVEITVAAETGKKGAGKLRGTLSLRGAVVAELSGGKFVVHAPELWWPNGYGEQPLYTVELELVEKGEVLDTWSSRVGLRTIELDRHADEFGESFQFVVNGLPIFAKGASWIPANSFVSAVDRATYDNLLSSAAAAHMNMIRVWGGGIYEMDDFYDLCDEKGLLVWQDFMFACALYPGGKGFLASVAEEAAFQVKRLGGHACMALWCGNNEIEQMPQEILKSRERKKAYEDVFYKILPDAVSRWDGVTPYWPSSPHNPKGYRHGHINEAAGDAHFWDVWHLRKPVKRYEEASFRFYSEFGMQSYSSPEVTAAFCPPEELNIFAPAMENHQKNGSGNAIILDYVSRRYRMPAGYDALAYLSQLNQAYCMKVAVEHFRRSMPRTMGALYWQLNDCWPVFSWSSLEFGGKWKALHWAAKRFFAPVLVSAWVPGDESVGTGNSLISTIHDVLLYTVYDGVRPTTGKLEWKLCHLDGRVLEAGEKKVTLRYGKSQLARKLDYAEAMKRHGASSLYLRVRLESAEGAVSEDTVFLTAPRRVNFPRAPISTCLEPVAEGEWELTLVSDVLQYQCEIILPGVQTDDNFFDLYPGEPRHIRLRAAGPVGQRRIEKALRVRSLVDTY